MEGAISILGGVGDAVTTLSGSLFEVITSAAQNNVMIQIIGLAVGCKLLGWAIGLVKRH